MNILLWILQILLSLHTVTGAVWKFTNSEQAVPSLSAIPHAAWMALSVIEIICAIMLVLPMFNKRLGIFVPIGAAIIAAEMLLFSGLHLASGDANYAPMIYWLVVAALCAIIAYGRFYIRPFIPSKPQI